MSVSIWEHMDDHEDDDFDKDDNDHEDDDEDDDDDEGDVNEGGVDGDFDECDEDEEEDGKFIWGQIAPVTQWSIICGKICNEFSLKKRAGGWCQRRYGDSPKKLSNTGETGLP